MFANLEYGQKRKLQLELGLTKLHWIEHMPEGSLQITYNYYFSGFVSKFAVPKTNFLKAIFLI